MSNGCAFGTSNSVKTKSIAQPDGDEGHGVIPIRSFDRGDPTFGDYYKNRRDSPPALISRTAVCAIPTYDGVGRAVSDGRPYPDRIIHM